MRRSLFIIASAIYIVTAIWLLFFFPFTHASRLNPSAQRFVNLIPFETTSEYFYNAWKYRNEAQIRELLMNVGGNILLFVPLGVIVYVLKRKKRYWYTPLIYGFLISLVVETTQILTNVGNFDVDDVMLNTLGCLLGFLLWRQVHKQ